MGSGSTVRKDYKTTTGYFCEKDYDRDFGSGFWFFIEPLNGIHDEKFFYVRNMPDGQYEVIGEGYVFYRAAHLREHKKEMLKELGDTVFYYFINESGKVVKRESSRIKRPADKTVDAV